LQSRGQAVVELAIILPFFALLVLGGLDAGRAYYYTTALTGAAREGVRVGSDHMVCTDAIMQGVNAAIPEITPVSVAITTTCAACYGTGPGCGSSFHPGSSKPFAVTVTWQFRPDTPLLAQFLPGGMVTLSGRATGPIL
jgi:Flp pilus assembly protein TadG